MVWDPIYFLLRFPLRFLAVGNNHCDALRAEILEEIKCGNYGLTLQKGADEKFRGKLGELSKDGAHTIQEERNISNSMNLGSETLYLGIQ